MRACGAVLVVSQSGAGSSGVASVPGFLGGAGLFPSVVLGSVGAPDCSIGG